MRMGHVVALATVALIATACSAGQYIPPTTEAGLPPTTSVPPIPAVVTSATPSGWVPVAYGDAQVSVPPTFSVFYPGWPSCGTAAGGTAASGAVYLGSPNPAPIPCPPNVQFRVATSVGIRQGDVGGFPLLANLAIMRNGLRLYPLINHTTSKTVGYYSPALGVEVIGSGPLAGNVSDTLTRSPRSVVLAAGPAPSVPSGWHTVRFERLTFDAPESWPVNSTAVTGDDFGPLCSPGVTSFVTTEVALSTDQRQLVQPGCLIAGPPKAEPPVDAVEVDAGNITWFPFVPSFSEHCLHPHGLTACPATTPAFSILALRVTVPGRATPLLVSIGLAGNGIIARTIVYSLRAA
jgi:hypothetical protein